MSTIKKLRIPITWIFAILLCCIILFSSSVWEDGTPFFSDLLFLIGTILVGMGTLGRLWCFLYIGGYKTKNLVTVGPYSISRNPLYFFSLLGGIGLGFASESLLIPTIVAVAFALYYPFVIRSEEKKLKKMHPNEFEVYINTTPVFFSKIIPFDRA